MKIIDEINLYLKNLEQKQFENIFFRLNSADEKEIYFLIQSLEKLMPVAGKPVITKNIAILYIGIGRFIEAEFYLIKWLNSIKHKDMEAVERLQYVAVKRHNINIAWNCIQELKKQKYKENQILMCELRYSMIVGHNANYLTNIGEQIINNGINNYFEADALFELAKRTKNINILAILIKSNFSKYLLEGIGGRSSNIINKMLMRMLIKIIKEKYSIK